MSHSPAYQQGWERNNKSRHKQDPEDFGLNKMSRSTRGPNAEIDNNIQLLSRKNTKLERMLAKIGTKADNHEFLSQLNEERTTTTQLVKEIIAGIKNNTGADRQVLHRLSSQFDKELKKYQSLVEQIESKEKTVLKAVEQRDERKRSISDVSSSPESSSSRGPSHVQVQIEDFLEFDAEEIEARHHQIKQLETDVIEVAEMYRDLQQLVTEQQESIDVIENNIEETRQATESAHSELLETERLQSKARKKKCCLLFITLAVLVGVVVVVYLTSK